MQTSTFFWTQPLGGKGRGLVPAMLAAGLLGFLLAAPRVSADDDVTPADLIITNAHIITVSSNYGIANSLAVAGDRILAVGREKQMTPFKGPATRIVDADSKVILPGLYDGIVQSYKAALSEVDGPLPVITSIADAQEYIRAQAAKNPPGSWIVLERLYPTRVKEGRLPTLKELDEATTNNPVYWNCGRISMVNSKALEVSKITAETQSPVGGQIVKDPKTLKPTGLLRNAGQLLKVTVVTNATSHQEQRVLLKRLYKLYNEQGITSIAESSPDTDAIDLFRELRDDQQLTVRINCSRTLELGKNLDESIARLDAITNAAKGKLAYGPTGVGDDWVRIGALRTILDGEAANASAYLRTPYGIGPTYKIAEPAYRGVLFLDPQGLPDLFAEAVNRGWQLDGHCAGDASMDLLLNTYQAVQYRTNITSLRFLLERADFQAQQNWPKCQALRVGATLEPICLYKDGYSLTKTLGVERMNWFMPLKTWFDKGVVIGAGSGHVAKLDSHASFNPWNPWLGMWITLTRSTDHSTRVNPDEALSREQAVRLYTLNNALLNFEDNIKGSIEPGKYADFIMIDRDILKCPVDDVKDTKVLLTVLGGKVVWEARSEQLASAVDGAKEAK